MIRCGFGSTWWYVPGSGWPSGSMSYAPAGMIHVASAVDDDEDEQDRVGGRQREPASARRRVGRGRGHDGPPSDGAGHVGDRLAVTRSGRSSPAARPPDVEHDAEPEDPDQGHHRRRLVDERGEDEGRERDGHGSERDEKDAPARPGHVHDAQVAQRDDPEDDERHGAADGGHGRQVEGDDHDDDRDGQDDQPERCAAAEPPGHQRRELAGRRRGGRTARSPGRGRSWSPRPSRTGRSRSSASSPRRRARAGRPRRWPSVPASMTSGTLSVPNTPMETAT